MAEQIDLRQDFHLATDPGWVRSVLADPRSVEWGHGIWLSPEELAALEGHERAESSIQRVAAWYGAVHRDAYAGLWFDAEGTAIVQFTQDVPVHAAALAGLVAPDASPYEVREVEWTRDELDAAYEELRDEHDWFREQGLRLDDVSVSVPANRVVLQVLLPEPDPAAEARIRDHLGADGRISLDLRLDRVGQLPRAAGLVVQLRDPSGAPIPGLTCQLDAAIHGAEGENVFRTSDEHGRCTWGAKEIRVTDYQVLVRLGHGGRVLARAAATASAEQRVEVIVTVAR